MKNHAFYALSLLVLFAFVASCEKQEVQDNVDKGTPDAETVPNTKASCEATGGTWAAFGISPIEKCVLPASDAGKECSDSSECEGSCVAELSKEDNDKVLRGQAVSATGKCTSSKSVFGCFPIVTQGKVDGILCID